MKEINTMILPNRPMSDKYLQGVTVCVSYIGQGVGLGKRIIYRTEFKEELCDMAVRDQVLAERGAFRIK
jgi:hypothetical protein